MALLLYLVSLLVSYVFAQVVYRLYFHPLAKFPGPKAAALTALYEWYCQWSHEGTFPLVLDQLHAKYGNFVRIGPNEIHIADPDCYDAIYNFSPEIDKFNSTGTNSSSTGGLFHQWTVEASKLQRRPYEAPFSRPAVIKKESLIRDKIESVAQILEKACEGKEIVDISSCYRALTTDIIASFAFGKDMDLIHDPQKAEHLYAVWRATWKRIARYEVAPSRKEGLALVWLMGSLSPQHQDKQDPETLKAYGEYEKEMHTYVDDTVSKVKRDTENTSVLNAGSLPAFQEALSSKHALPLHFDRSNLYPNGNVVFVAGSETTASAMGTGAFHILSNPSILERLQKDLDDAWKSGPLSWTDLEKIPILKGIVMEALRIDLGVSRRFVRVNPHNDTPLKDGVVIPRGSVMSMSHRFMFFNEEIFSDPYKFDPDRWTQSEEETRRLSKYMQPFSKGNRQCIAYSIAQAELYVTFAELHRRFDMELVDTTREDVECVVDRVLSFPKAGKMTVKVNVLRKRV